MSCLFICKIVACACFLTTQQAESRTTSAATRWRKHPKCHPDSIHQATIWLRYSFNDKAHTRCERWERHVLTERRQHLLELQTRTDFLLSPTCFCTTHHTWRRDTDGVWEESWGRERGGLYQEVNDSVTPRAHRTYLLGNYLHPVQLVLFENRFCLLSLIWVGSKLMRLWVTSSFCVFSRSRFPIDEDRCTYCKDCTVCTHKRELFQPLLGANDIH